MTGNAERQRPMATCPADGEPLVFTFEFRGYEFVCVPCGRKYGFLSPKPVEVTAEREARLAELQTQYDTERAQRVQAAQRATS